MKDIVVLGSTGSIGKQTLDVAAFQGYRVRAISACRSVRLAEEQIRRFHPVYCAMADEQAAKDLQFERAAELRDLLFELRSSKRV